MTAKQIMTRRSTHQATFVIDRTYPASPARIFDNSGDCEHGTRGLLDDLDAAPGREGAIA